ncbi:MAG: HAD family phosphatase [Pseudomonadota bacterium]
MKTVIFDIGNVVLQWQPERLYPERFADVDAMQAALSTHDFAGWYGTGGGAWEDRISAVEDPDAKSLFTRYLQGYSEAVRTPVPGTADIIGRLKTQGTRILALTNAPIEADDLVRRHHRGVMEHFEDVFVSGREGLAKPRPEAFQALLDRNAVQPEDALFTDDSPAYAKAAETLGLKAHVFAGADGLEQHLIEEGYL